MKLIYNPLGICMDIENSSDNVLIIENKYEYERFLLSYRDQIEGRGEAFCTDEENARLFRNSMMVTSPFDLVISEKSIQKKLYMEIEGIIDSSNIFGSLIEMHADIVNLMDELCMMNSIDIDYDEEFSVSNLLKYLNFKIKTSEGPFCERLINYMDINKKLLGKDFVVLANCDAFLDNRDYLELSKWIKYNEVTVLYVSNKELDLQQKDNAYIIDNDLCVLH